MDLHIFFLPFVASGHMIPMVDLARLFSGRGVRVTIVAAVATIPLIQPTVDLANTDPSLHHPIQLISLQSESDVPESHDLTPPKDPNMFLGVTSAIDQLAAPFMQLLQAHHPDCLIADMYYPWASRLAKEFGIPRLLFHGSSCFSTVIFATIGELGRLYESEGEQPFLVPGLRHQIKLTWSQIPDNIKLPPNEFMQRVIDGSRGSYGMITNSFDDLEKDYIDLAQKRGGMKLWCVGPVSLYNQVQVMKTVRGNMASINSDECLRWFDSKKPRSVLYLCFGSLGRFTTAQLREIALGLEASGNQFVWVVRNAGESSEWLPKGFEERVSGEGKGLIIKGWAPQLLILNHAAVGGFVTHCGWNSCLEGMSAGLPLITWPLFAEQFANEKLLVDVLRIGIAVGSTVCSDKEEERVLVKGGEIKKAINELMGSGDEAEERRKRARRVGEMARKAVEEGGGSSYLDMSRLLEDLSSLKSIRLTNAELMI